MLAGGPMKTSVNGAVEGLSDELVGLSHAIHAEPETAWEEHRSVAKILDLVANDPRFTVTERLAGIDTAFAARVGTGSLHLGVFAEYDALPGIGHACGHNVIAASAVGTVLAMADLVDDLDLSITLFGSPAEEDGGGKISLLNSGALRGLHAAMMVHPAPAEADRMHCLARERFDVHYRGRSAHASAFPEAGINAADAITLAQVGLGLLRQHIRPTDRIHGIVTYGGDAPNIVPDHTTYAAYIRARTLDELDDLRPRTAAVLAGAALSTGCTHEVRPSGHAYSEFLDDEDTLALFRANAEALGRRYPSAQRRRRALEPHDGRDAFSASTDMANVSLALPAIHPMLGIDALGSSNHQPEFAAAAATASADQAVLHGAIAMAATCVDLASDPHERRRLLVDEWPR
jgi:amidohydrolase